jgi:antiviral helicase SKI2
MYEEKVDLIYQRDELEEQMRDESLAFKPLLDAHIRILQNLSYVDKDNGILIKGRVSIEINSCNEILATELLFHGLFDSLSPQECAAVASILVTGSTSSQVMSVIPDPIMAVFPEILSVANELFQMFCEEHVNVEENWMDVNVAPGLCEVVLDWANGLPFRSIMDKTDVPEGNVVRVINMVNEVLRDLSNAAKIMGCMFLSERFDAAAELIKRDIIFASSLYFD